MDTRIKEKDLGKINPMRFQRFLAAEEGEAQSGVPVFYIERLPKFYGAGAEAELLADETLIVEVDEAVNDAVVSRLRDAITDLISLQSKQ